MTHRSLHIIWVLLLLGCSSVLNAQFSFRTGTNEGGVIAPSVVPWVPVKVNHLWGYADTAGRVRIEPTFDAVSSFNGKYAVVQIGNKAFVIDTSGTVLNPSGHDQILQLEDSIFAVYKNSSENGEGGWGAEKIGGLEILPKEYDYINRLSWFVFSCRQDSSLGFFTRTGILIAPVKYDTGWVFNGTFVGLKHGKYFGVRSFTGVIVLPDSCTEFKSLNASTVAGRINNKWGAGKNDGRVVIPFNYDTLAWLSSLFAVAGNDDSMEVYTTGNTAHRVPGTYIHAVACGGLWVKAYAPNKKCALIDTGGNIIIPPIYDDIVFSGDGNWIVVIDKKFGIVNAGGKIIVPPTYTLIQPFRNGLSVVFAENLQGLINGRGEILSKPANCLITIRRTTAKVVMSDGKVEYIKTDGNGNVIQRDEYEEVRTITIGGDNSYKRRTNLPGRIQSAPNDSLPRAPVGDSLVWFYNIRTLRFGLLDAYNGDTLLPAIYSVARKIGFGYTVVGLAQLSPGIILDGTQWESSALLGVYDDTLGKFVIQPQYTRLEPFHMSADGRKTVFQFVRSDGMAGLVYADGTERILQASCIDFLSGGVAAFCVGGRWEMSEAGKCRMPWEMFRTTFNVANFGPYRNVVASNNNRYQPITHVGGKWGYLDAEGNILVAPVYDSYQHSVGGTCLVKLNKKWGMIDTAGNTRIPFEYDFLRYMFTRTDTFVQSQHNKVRYGCIDTLGNVVVPVQYSKILPLGHGLIAVNSTGKWGVVKTNGQMVTEEKFLEIRPYAEGYAAVRVGRLWGIIDTNGTEVIAPQFDDAGQFSEGLCAVKKAQKWGYMDASGQVVITHQFLTAGPFFRGVAPVKTKSGCGLINRNGATVLKPIYDVIERLSTTPVFTYRSGGLYGLVSTTGKILSTARYAKIKDIGAGRLSYQEGLYWGLMDTLGNRITDSNYERMGTFADGLCPVNVQSQWGFINTSGQYRVTPKYRLCGQFGNGLAPVIDMMGNHHIIDTSGKITVTIRKNAGMTPFTENKTVVRFIVKQKTTFSFYTRFGHRLARDEYADALSFYHGAAPVKVGYQWGLINFTGRYLLKPCYTQMSPFRDGVSIVQHTASFGLLTMSGQELLSPKYDVIVPEGSVIRLQQSNAVGYLHRDGREMWPVQE